MSDLLRVGSVPYLVGRPLDHGLSGDPRISLEHDVPSRLIERLRDGSLDVALVSSIELFRMPGYTYLPGLCVGGRGVVSSVQVFLRGPIESVGTIAMDPASRTSQALVQILLAEREGGPPEYIFPELEQNQRELPAEAWLSIGDRALRDFHAGGYPVFNPSQVWAQRTGLPFVFAAWIVRPGVDIAPYREAFEQSYEQGQAAIPELAQQAGKRWALPTRLCHEYLAQECAYHLGDQMSRALQAFGAQAEALGLTHPGATPTGVPG